jgi:zinc protease
MTRRVLAVLGLMPTLAASGQSPAPIPRHPSELDFPAAVWTPPSASAARVELPGGPVVYVVADHSLPLFDLVAAARIGSFLDPAQRPGLSTVATELLARGGTASLEPDRFDAEVERLGGRVAARSTPTSSALGIDGPSWAADELIDLFLDLLAAPGFDEERLEDLTDNLREGMRRRNDDPLAVLEREWERLLYGSDHFSTRALTPAALDRLGRGDLLAFHRRAWRPENLLFAISGDLDRDRVLARLRERSAAWPGPEAAESLPWPPPRPGPGAGPGAFLLARELPQTKVFVGHRLPPVAEADRPALALLAEVLGGSGAISRIQGCLRTAEGLVYRSVTGLEAGELWPGDLRIFFETRPEGTIQALELVRDELARIRRQPVPERELEAARAALLATLRTSFDTPEEIAGRLAENALLGRAGDHWPRWSAALSEVDALHVREAAERYLRPDELTILVLGPLDEAARKRLEALAGAPVRLLPKRDPETQEPLGRSDGEAPAQPSPTRAGTRPAPTETRQRTAPTGGP